MRPASMARPHPGRKAKGAGCGLCSCQTCREGGTSAEELRGWYQARVASWSIPDAALLVSELPHAGTGKLLKTALRERYGGYYLRGG